MKLSILIACLMFFSSTCFGLEDFKSILSSDPLLSEIYGNNCTSINGIEFSSLPTPKVSLQQLIDRAEDGDTIYIPSGYYTNTTTYHVDKNLTVVGEGSVVVDTQKSCEILHIENPTTSVALENLVFVNGNGEDGGAIDTTAKNLTIKNCSFSNNSALDGSTIHSDGNELHIIDSVFVNSLGFSNGTINARNGKLILDNILFKDNIILDYCICIASSCNASKQSVNKADLIRIYEDCLNGTFDEDFDILIRNCTFSDNKGYRSDEGTYNIAVANIAGKILIKDSKFLLNYMDYGSGTLLCCGYPLVIINSTVSNTTVTKSGICAGVFLDEGTAGLFNCEISMNKLPLERLRFPGPYENQQGGGVYINTGATISLFNCSIHDNLASEGGGIFNYEGTLVMNNGIIFGNSAPALVLSDGRYGGLGGGIANTGSMILNGVSISGNDADNGGGIYNEGTLSINESALSNNLGRQGGTIYNNQAGTVILDNRTIFQNNSAQDGGAIYNSATGVVRIDGITLFRNNIVQDAQYGGRGGAIYNANGGTIELKGSSHLTGNEATCPEDRDCYNGTGGAIFNAGNITIENATFNANKAISGSAIWSEGNLTDINSHYHRNSVLAVGTIAHKQPIGKPLGTTILNNPTISRNTAGQSGAGIFDSGNIVVNGGSITKNIAANQGGAIHCEPLANPHVTPKLCLNRTTVSDNVAGTNGGAIFIVGNTDGSPILDLWNAYIFDNNAQNGGAIYGFGSVTIQFGSGAMTNITNNVANSNGGGIFLGSSGVLNTDNAKITYNSAKAGKGGGIYLAKGSLIKRGHDDISHNTPDNIYQAK